MGVRGYRFVITVLVPTLVVNAHPRRDGGSVTGIDLGTTIRARLSHLALTVMRMHNDDAS